LVAGALMGMVMIGTPAGAHVGGTVSHLWNQHIKPKTDARYARKNAEAWHLVGAAGEPAFMNSWTNYGGGFSSAAFYKDPWGVVHLKGLVQAGTIGTTIFQLPSGYLPSEDLIFANRSNNASGEVRIDVGCAFIFCSQDVIAQAGSNVWFSLDGISFRAG
jgi:hypothetical protein